MACAEYHKRKWPSKCDAAGHFYCTTSTAGDKTFPATKYEDNGQRNQDEGKCMKA